jgi:hypothetical protein
MRLSSTVTIEWELTFLPAKTLDDVIVDHPYSLHEGIADGCPHKGEAVTLQFLAHRNSFPDTCGNVLQGLPGVLKGLSTNYSSIIIRHGRGDGYPVAKE